ncbi:hypothetical protein V493_07036 [Pseudogymnoascus sp. VKM F-4281 (FW-2241)]|nr:hypothetical protein V493_07036 [Pseudogymnoascus sp. VKM F-4281 (FW-2241)]
MPYPEGARGDKLFSCKQNVCLVTGGETGIGLMAAQALIANGARVYIVSSNREALGQTAERLRASQGGSIIPIVCDVTDKEDLVRLVGQIEKRERYGINLVVAASGSEAVRGTAPSMDAKELQQMLFAEDQTKWISTFNTNVCAMYFITVAFLPLLQKCSGDGDALSSVIIVASMSGLQSRLSGYFSYSASKAATIHLSKMMANEFKDFNVRVNCIAPGYFKANDTEEAMVYEDRLLDEQTRLVPVGEKWGTESEIAQGVLFLAKNRFVTGEVLNIDNGEFLRNPALPG